MNTPAREVYWYKGRPAQLPSLAAHASADAVVVGGGLAGLSAAYEFAKAGKSVIVLEKDFCGNGATGKSSGFISQDSELELTDLVDNLGHDLAKKLWEFVGSGMEFIRSRITEGGIACDYQEQDYVFLALDKKGLHKAKREHDSRVALGYESTYIEGTEIEKVVSATRRHGGVRYKGTFGINPFAYAQGLKEELLKMGVKIYEGTPVVGVIRDGVETPSHTVTASHVVLAIDGFLTDLISHSRDVYHVQTFLTISKPLSEADMKRLFPQGPMMVADSDMVYQYFRPTGDGRLLLGGGTLRTTYSRNTPRSLAAIAGKLARYAKEQFPHTYIQPEYIWPGFLGVSKDLLPLTGRLPQHPSAFFVAGATGLAWATELGRYVAHKAMSGRDDFDAYFNPLRRFPGDPPARTLQRIFSTPLTFMASHGFVKYFR